MGKEKAEGRIMTNEEIFLLLKAKCKDIVIKFRENMYFKFKEFCNSKCKNRVADFSECNFSINSVRIITMILLDTNRISRLDLSRNKPVYAIPEEDTIYIEDGVITFIGTRPYYEFNNGQILEENPNDIILAPEHGLK